MINWCFYEPHERIYAVARKYGNIRILFSSFKNNCIYLQNKCINMQSKTERQIKIKEILSVNKISKQEELLSLLIEKGFSITQATLSRDLKELNVGTKYDKDFGHIYFIDEEQSVNTSTEAIELNSVVSLEISRNLAVLKTLPGFANSVGAIIDERNIPDIVGTVAGNDTILIIIKENIKKTDFLDSLNKEFVNILRILKP